MGARICTPKLVKYQKKVIHKLIYAFIYCEGKRVKNLQDNLSPTWNLRNYEVKLICKLQISVNCVWFYSHPEQSSTLTRCLWHFKTAFLYLEDVIQSNWFSAPCFGHSFGLYAYTHLI